MVRPMSAATPAGPFTEIKRVRGSDDVVAQVRDAIISGQIGAGERLPNERDLGRTFGVSRATLREGLRVLEALGAIEIRPGASGGIFVAEPQGDQVGAALEALLRFRRVTAQELSEFRGSFERETAHWAAERATAEDVERLHEIVGRFKALAADPSTPWDVLSDVDIEFHNAVADASKNEVRVAIMLGIHRALRRASGSIAEYMSSPERASLGRELAGIVEAIGEHKPAIAAKRMLRHVTKFSLLEREVQERDGTEGHA